jgi:hypothetical protein
MAVVTNHGVVVTAEIEARLAESVPPRPRSEVFDLIAAEAALSGFDLSVEEIEAGLTDGGGDGGIDAAYVFVNQELVTDDHELLDESFTVGPSYRGASVSLWLIQAKEEATFKSGTVVTLNDSLRSLLDPSKSLTDLIADGYSEAVLAKIFQFRDCLARLLRFHPQPSVNFVYVAVGDAGSAANSVKVKLREFEALIGEMQYGLATTSLLGAKEVWQALSENPTYGSELRTIESFAHENSAGERSYVCLVTLKDYIAFITEPDGSYRDYLFDGNVRHHEGENAPVNREISASLADPNSPEFWWLNNGVTVICSTASSQGKVFALDDVQIVNGLQTSRAIYDTLHDAPANTPALSHHVLVRVIESQDSPTINKVIRATNRQTPVRVESLRATDDLQMLIERHLGDQGIFYDRRRNYYKNIGKPRSKILSVRALTQALLAVALGKPDEARARPGDYLKVDKNYELVFNEHARDCCTDG